MSWLDPNTVLSPRSKAIKKKRDKLVRNVAYEKECEKAARRGARIKQVRAQSMAAARDVRQRVRREQDNLVKATAKAQLAAFIRSKEEQLATLEAQYQGALAQVGIGHEGAREQEEYNRWAKKRAAEQAKTAKERGRVAIREENAKERVKQQVKESKTHLKESVALTERLRAAQVRQGLVTFYDTDKCQVVEVQAGAKSGGGAPAKRVVKVSNRGRYVDDDVEGAAFARKIQVETRRGKGGGGNAVEAAITALQDERDSLFLEERRRQESAEAQRREKSAWLRYVEPCFHREEEYDEEEEFDKENLPFSIIHHPPTSPRTPHHQMSESSALSPFDDIRMMGPSQRGSSISPSSKPPGLKAPQGRMASSLGSHPESAFSCPSPRGQRQSGEVGSEEAVPSTRSNEEFDRVGHQELIKPYQGTEVAKKDDRSFVAKVLKDLNYLDEDDRVEVKINFEEVSRLSSSGMTSSSGHGEETVTSSSTSDITRTERFLARGWERSGRAVHGRDQPPEKTVPPVGAGMDLDFGRVQGLIDELVNTSTRPSEGVTDLKDDSRLRSNPAQLRSYIEKLLEMRRKEIDELSITDISSFASPCGVPNRQATPKTGRLFETLSTTGGGHQKSTSLALSSSSSSTPSLPANKTVRFEVDQSTTEVVSTSHAVNVGRGQNLSNIDQQKREEQRSLQVTASSAANQRTNLSLVEIQKIYHEQRLVIEAEMEMRRLAKEKSRISNLSSSLSEGALSSSLALSSSSASTDSTTKDSSNSSERSDKLKRREEALLEMRHGWTKSLNERIADKENRIQSQQNHPNNLNPPGSMGVPAGSRSNRSSSTSNLLKPSQQRRLQVEQRLLNKSSSSSSTSNATQEFLTRLRRMEIPQLKRPPPQHPTQNVVMVQVHRQQPSSSSSGGNTSADLLRVKDLDSSEPPPPPTDFTSTLNISGVSSSTGPPPHHQGKQLADEISNLSLSSSSDNSLAVSSSS